MLSRRSSTITSASDTPLLLSKKQPKLKRLFKRIFGMAIVNEDLNQRSLSTGDLVTPTTAAVAAAASDYMEFDFSKQKSKSLPDNFDDCDLVPMDFKKRVPTLMPQTSKKARRLAEQGQKDMPKEASFNDIHIAQPWFYANSTADDVKKFFFEENLQDGSFLITEKNKKYVLSVAQGGKIDQIVIGFYVNSEGRPRFRLDCVGAFDNLVELVACYRQRKGFYLQTTLKRTVDAAAYYNLRKALATLQRTRA